MKNYSVILSVFQCRNYFLPVYSSCLSFEFSTLFIPVSVFLLSAVATVPLPTLSPLSLFLALSPACFLPTFSNPLISVSTSFKSLHLLLFFSLCFSVSRPVSFHFLTLVNTRVVFERVTKPYQHILSHAAQNIFSSINFPPCF